MNNYFKHINESLDKKFSNMLNEGTHRLNEARKHFNIAFIDCSGSNTGDVVERAVKHAKENFNVKNILYFNQDVIKEPAYGGTDLRAVFKYMKQKNIPADKVVIYTDDDINYDFNSSSKTPYPKGVFFMDIRTLEPFNVDIKQYADDDDDSSLGIMQSDLKELKYLLDLRRSIKRRGSKDKYYESSIKRVEDEINYILYKYSLSKEEKLNLLRKADSYFAEGYLKNKK